MKLTSLVMLFVLVFMSMNICAQESGEIVFTVTVDAAAPSVLTNTLIATSTTLDPVAANNVAHLILHLAEPGTPIERGKVK